MTRNLLLSGGIYHPFAETSAAIAAHLDELGIASEICGMADGLDRLETESFELVTINALSFSMTQADKYAPLRASHAFNIRASHRAAMSRHVARGRGLLGLHTATICFDTWPEWEHLLGASWVWGQSSHPMPGYLDVKHESGAFQIWDELYTGLRLDPAAEVRAVASLADGGPKEPVLTTKGRAVYLALGHDLTAVSSPGYAKLLKFAANLALHSEEA